jgi:hypothetical protein
MCRLLNGKIVFEPTGTDKLKNAEIQLHKRKTEIASGKQPEVSGGLGKLDRCISGKDAL